MCRTQTVIIVAGREKVCPVFMEIIIVLLDLVSTNFQGKSSSIFVSLLIIFLSIFEVKIEVARDSRVRTRKLWKFLNFHSPILSKVIPLDGIR